LLPGCAFAPDRTPDFMHQAALRSGTPGRNSGILVCHQLAGTPVGADARAGSPLVPPTQALATSLARDGAGDAAADRAPILEQR
jgi:hypothetical protein